MKIILRKKKETNECDTADSAMVGGDMPLSYDNMFFGMGPVNPMGGPDRWDMGFKFSSSLPKKRKYRIRRKK